MIVLRHVLRSRAVQMAATLFAVSLLVAGSALLSAVRIQAPPEPSEEPRLALAVPLMGTPTGSDLIMEAVDAAPFSPSRETGGEEEIEPEVMPPETSQLDLVGTVVDVEGGSFVLLSASNAPPKVLRIGETLAGHRLRSVGQASAVLSRISDGERVELHVRRGR